MLSFSLRFLSKSVNKLIKCRKSFLLRAENKKTII